MLVEVPVLDAQHGIDKVGRHVFRINRRQSQVPLLQEIAPIGGFQRNDAARSHLGGRGKMHIVQEPCQRAGQNENCADIGCNRVMDP